MSRAPEEIRRDAENAYHVGRIDVLEELKEECWNCKLKAERIPNHPLKVSYEVIHSQIENWIRTFST